jgi:methylmalonyl-CoA/ethylmalonyl-CoA epimerase
MNKIEHIGIAVKDLEKSNALFASLLGKKHYKVEELLSEKVKTSFFKSENHKIELLQATDTNSTIAKFIDKKGGIYCYK